MNDITDCIWPAIFCKSLLLSCKIHVTIYNTSAYIPWSYISIGDNLHNIMVVIKSMLKSSKKRWYYRPTIRWYLWMKMAWWWWKKCEVGYLQILPQTKVAYWARTVENTWLHKAVSKYWVWGKQIRACSLYQHPNRPFHTIASGERSKLQDLIKLQVYSVITLLYSSPTNCKRSI